MERCVSYIGENAAECVKTNAFLNLTKEGLIKLISSDYVSMERLPEGEEEPENKYFCSSAWRRRMSGAVCWHGRRIKPV